MDIIGLLPPELSQYIFRFLRFRDLCISSLVCKEWRELINSNSIWRSLCFQNGWHDTNMVDDYRTHRMPRILPSVPDLSDKCKWMINFERNYQLPITWERGNFVSYELRVIPEPVTCFDCHNDILAVGHEDGQVVVFNVHKLPYLITKFNCLLPNYRVLKIKVHNNYIITVQSLLVQIYKYNDNTENYDFVDAKSFEIGLYNVDKISEFGLKSDKFIRRYDEYVGGDKLDQNWVVSRGIFIYIYDNILYLACRDFQVVYGYNIANCKRVKTIHIPNLQSKIRDFIGEEFKFYLTYASHGVRHITCYDLKAEKWIFEVTTLNIKTQRVILGETVIIGIGVCNSGLVHNGMITVWDRTGLVLSSKPTSVYLPINCVVTKMDCVIYCENTTVTVWHPVLNVILKQINFNFNVIYLKCNCFNFLTVITSTQAYVCNWLEGKLLYKIRPAILNNGEYDNLFYDDKTMMIVKNINNQIDIMAFC